MTGPPSSAAPSSVTPQTLMQWLLARHELALLDVREARAYVAGHLTLARLAPLSTLALELPALVPRADTPVVLVDDGEPQGPASRAADLLARLGYTDVRMLEGGMAAWQAAGFASIDGYGALVKAFGDQVRLRHATPTVRGDALRRRQASGEPVRSIDVRPAAEYAYLTLAGTANHAGCELALRDWSARAAPWVVNCFSRTRGIIGATTLHVLGHPDAHFLEDGVMQWALDGGPVVENAPPAFELPSAADEVLRQRADALIERFGLPLLRPEALRRFSAEGDRTLYLFDLRPGAEARAMPAGVRAVPGGQLLMHFENLVGTRHARIVLLDDPHRLRAAVTAFWLRQLDQAEVFILDGGLPALAPPPTPRLVEPQVPAGEALSPLELASLSTSAPDQVLVVDVGPSIDFERQHLPQARFLLPFTLEPLADLWASGRRIVFSSADGRAARWVASEACRRWPEHRIGWLVGGTAAWQAAGLPTEQAFEPAQLLTPFDDDWGSVMRMPASQRSRAWADYLVWERGLSARVARDPTVRFRLF